MTLTNSTPTIESMPNEDNNEFMFSTSTLIKSQEACKIGMEATWALLSLQFLEYCDMWYCFHLMLDYWAFFVIYDSVAIKTLAIHK
jgi:hypothetical protein